MRHDHASPHALRAAALLLVPVLAACGGGGSAATSNPGGATSAPGGATSAPVATAAAPSTAGGGGGGGAGATGGPVTDVTKLCDLLGAGDFSSVAIEGAGAATVNSDGPGSAYCSFTAASAAQGGIEFDAFVGDDPNGTYNTVLAETTGLAPTTMAVADKAAMTAGVQGQADKPAAVLVQKGKLVFTIAVPAGLYREAALNALALIVLSRSTGLTG
ncbi:MAG TPA: hypothetical protein VJ850_10200 [Candidatus Limnocylindrales bacterium]|nr:hypothetical protein [Candidatus Limnocylindrales bacterium]